MAVSISNELPKNLLIPLWARAIEQQLPSPIIYDHKSVELLTAIDFDFKQWPVDRLQSIHCRRSAIIDGWVQSYLKRYPQGTIIEIGAGLSTRFERLDNGQLQWFMLDAPAVLDLRQQLFPLHPRRFSLPASLAELNWNWVDQVQSMTIVPPLLIAEDIFMYLEKDQVVTVLAGLADRFYGSILLFDAILNLWHKFCANPCWRIADIYELHDWNICYQVLDVQTLPNFPAKYRQYLSLLARIADLPPLVGSTCCVTKLGFGYGRTAQRLTIL